MSHFSRHSWIIFLIYWLLLIYYLSSQEYSPLLNPTYKLELVNLRYEWREILAHTTLYFVLCLLMIKNLKLWSSYNQRKVIFVSALLCLVYAFSDEYHQTFVQGRTASSFDIACDSVGIILATLFMYLYEKRKA